MPLKRDYLNWRIGLPGLLILVSLCTTAWAGQFKVLHSFTGGPDGGFPYGVLLQDSASKLYGTTYGGGDFNFGTVFSADAAGNQTVLHSFAGPPDGVSGPPSNPNCDGTTNYCHDFGSILNFIEYVFGIGGAPLGTIGDGHSNYADHWAPDAVPTCVSQSVCPYSLSDFFAFDQPLGTFSPITGWKYPRSCFKNPKTQQCFGTVSNDAEPDNDALEE